MQELKLIEGWENEFEIGDCQWIYGMDLIDVIQSLLQQQAALSYQQGREEAIKECIKLSESLEASDTEFNEWRAFKGFRNALNDLLNNQQPK